MSAQATAPAQQPQLPLGLLEEDPAYLTRQLVTYIGNKRALLGLIRSAVEDVRRADGARQAADPGRLLGLWRRIPDAQAVRVTSWSSTTLEDYARVISECYLSNRGGRRRMCSRPPSPR